MSLNRKYGRTRKHRRKTSGESGADGCLNYGIPKDESHIPSSDILNNYDGSLRKAYLEIKKNFHKIDLSNKSLRVSLDFQSDGKVTVGGISVGLHSYPLIDTVPFVLNVREGALAACLENATSGLSLETSSSSPSMILHQTASLLLATSLEESLAIFENEDIKNKPDLTIGPHGREYNIDFTTGKGIREKLRGYAKRDMRVVAVDKRRFVRSVVGENEYLEVLYRQSKICDQKDVNSMKKRIMSQAAGRVTAMRGRTLDFFLNSSDEKLNMHQRAAQRAMVRYMADNVKDVAHKDMAEKSLNSISGEAGTSVIGYSSLCRYLSYEGLKKIPSEMCLKTGKREVVDLEPYLDADLLSIELENSGGSGTLSVGIPDSLKQSDISERTDVPFFSRSCKIKMSWKSYEGLRLYKTSVDKRAIKVKKELSLRKEINSKLGGKSRNYYDYKVGHGYTMDEEGNSMFTTKTSVESMQDIVVVEDIKNYSSVSELNPEQFDSILYNHDGFLDPADRLIMSQVADEDIIERISQSKIYQILVLYMKVSLAVNFNNKNGCTFIVRHPAFDMEAHCYSSGVPMRTDKGSLYVSLVVSGLLHRTYVWRRSDIIAFRTSASRLLSTFLPVCSKDYLSFDEKMRVFNMYSLLMFENSWGVSKILKPYRYMVSGHLYGDPQIRKQLSKLEESLGDAKGSVNSKLSVSYLICLLTNLKIGFGRTPCFGFRREDIGYEAFLLNLCPAETYGRRKHVCDIMKELAIEMRLYDDNKSNVMDIQDHFSYIVTSDFRSEKELEDLYRVHLNHLQRMGESSDGRFTMSPISALLNKPHIDKIYDKGFYGYSLPATKEVLTAKASYDSVNMRKGSTTESMTSLLDEFGLPTLGLMAIYLMDLDIIDLTFRMFDKDQQGGNREISIMSAMMRTLQSITETYAKEIGKRTDFDMLNNPLKVSLLCSDYEEARKSNVKIMRTVDQTRWGPNFNTVTFAYNYAIIFRRSNEAYIPMMTCFLSEFKVFEMPAYPELSGLMSEGYTLVGKTGESSMGQGIFHESSTLHHGWAHEEKERIYHCLYKRYFSEHSNMNFRVRLTSDDVWEIQFMSEREGHEMSRKEREKIRSTLVQFNRAYSYLLMVFCIKTSSYKNSDSSTSLEFNSVFFNEHSTGSNSLKFLNSLIQCTTSGSQKTDSLSVFSTITDCINSGLSDDEAILVMLFQLKTTLLIWGTPSEEVTLIISMFQKSYMTGNTSLYDKPAVCRTGNIFTDVISNNVLPFRKRTMIDTGIQKLIAMSSTGVSRVLLSNRLIKLLDNKRMMLSGSNAVVISRKLRSRASIQTSYNSYCEGLNITIGAYLLQLLRDNGESSMHSRDISLVSANSYGITLKPGFQEVVYRRNTSGGSSPMTLLVSSYPRVNHINCSSSKEEVFLHICRRRKVVEFRDLGNLEGKSMLERLVILEEEALDEAQNGMMKRLEYRQDASDHRVVEYLSRPNASYYPSPYLNKTRMRLAGIMSTSIESHYISLIRGYGSLVNERGSGRVDNFSIEKECLNMRLNSLINVSHALLEREKEGDCIYLNVRVTRMVDYDRASGNISLKDVNEVERVTQEVNLDEMDLSDFASLFMSSGIALAEECSEDNDGNSNLERMQEMIFGLGESSKRRVRVDLVYSLEVNRLSSYVTESWFKKSVLKNTILYEMISQGFVQNSTATQPETYLYYILQKSGQFSYTDTSAFVENSGIVHDVRLDALFNIEEEVERIYRAFLPGELVMSSTSAKLVELHNISLSPSRYRGYNFGNMPQRMYFTDRPDGDVMGLEEILNSMS